MHNCFSSDFKLGILGAGQLGKMLIGVTQRLDIATFMLDPDKNAPARFGCNSFEVGKLTEYDSVLNFGRKVNVLTIEIENVNVDALDQLVLEGIQVYPKPEHIRLLQNKTVQKAFYQNANIPTAPFSVFADVFELKDAVTANLVQIPFVWKSATGGYDGRGVSVIKNAEMLDNLPNVPCLAEALVDFEMELAVMVARNGAGDIKTYPLVEMEFHPTANMVETVLCPARVSEEIQFEATKIARKVAEELEFVGLLAVEMFLTKKGEILVNESAPRVHNSGHFTIEAAYTSQFEQHIRAITGLPLGSSEMITPAVMVNLTGEPGHTGEVFYENAHQALALPGVYPHFYGKKETRPFRKMGHVTVIGKNLEDAIEKATFVKNNIKVLAK